MIEKKHEKNPEIVEKAKKTAYSLIQGVIIVIFILFAILTAEPAILKIFGFKA